MDESHILDHLEIELQPDLLYTEQQMAILDRSIKTLKNKAILLFMVPWNTHASGEATWKQEDVICDCYPRLFVS